MNESKIESIEWHKDQLFKLLGDDDFIKIEGDIYSVKAELNEIIEKAKKRVWVKTTPTRKGHYREQEVGVGRKEEDDGPGKEEEYGGNSLTLAIRELKHIIEEIKKKD